MSLVTLQELRRILDYDPATGVFTSKTRRANCVYEGEVAGHVNTKGYRVIKIRGKAYKAHRLAIFYVTGAWPPEMVDHINGAKDDNRFANLRCADAHINNQNRHGAPCTSTSGVLGAQKGGWKGRKIVSEIQFKGVRHYLGVFPTPESANAAYVDAKQKLLAGGSP